MKTPTFDIEQQYWSQDISHIAGIDEAGMGALAGPVVAAAVIFSHDSQELFLESTKKIPIRDSKLLSEKQREKAVDSIKKYALSWAIGSASVQEIDAMNIRRASHVAMARAVESLSLVPQLMLIDGNPAIIHPSIFCVNIIKGDQLSYSIAAASIIAKVARDHLMKELDKSFPVYGFSEHKGYGSTSHMTALTQHGPTPHHRTSYAPVRRLLTKR